VSFIDARLVSRRWPYQLGPMCGRYDNLIPRDTYAALFRPVRVPRLNFPPRYNVAPTDQIPIVRVDPRDGERELTMARWGLIPFWMKEKPKVPHINARAETVHKLPLFREAFAKRRCLIPIVRRDREHPPSIIVGERARAVLKKCE
jgi:putative SOS response-associated peptidase YedK